MGEPTPAVEGLAFGDAVLVGRFRYDVTHDRWWWSDEMYRIHGFEPGDVAPTSALLVAHKHPDDVAHVQDVLAGAVANGEPFSCYHRIIDAQRRIRHVVAVGDAGRGPDGSVVELRGYLIDLTATRRREVAEGASAAVEAARTNRAVIEQAKGALMFVYGIDADAAFTLLAGVSQEHNVKVRTLAERIVHARGLPSMPAAQRQLSTLLHGRGEWSDGPIAGGHRSP